MVGAAGIEPATSPVWTERSPAELRTQKRKIATLGFTFWPPFKSSFWYIKAQLGLDDDFLWRKSNYLLGVVIISTFSVS